MGAFRMIIALLSLMAIAWVGGVVFEKIDFNETKKYALANYPLLKVFPFVEFWSTAFHPASLKFYIAPIGAMFAVFLGAAWMVKDIYALPKLRDAVHYVLSSMTGIAYPRLTVEAGNKKLIKGKINLIDVIGGPGRVTVQPGNVVMFRMLRRPSNITLGENYFLAPFETIGQIANLDDQHGEKKIVGTLTRDGIKVTIKDFHFRYRIFPEMKDGHPIRRTLEDPYPFDEKALWGMAYNLAVADQGLETWRETVERIITGGVTEFINRHNVDYLTSPRSNMQDPRVEMRNNVTFGGPKIGLRKIGAELLWVDPGHFEIDDDVVDNTRMDLWAAEWLGRAGIQIEEGRTWRELLRERGRAEGQAELVAAIADGLRNAESANDPAGNMRKILIMKAAQVIDSVKDSGRNQESPP
jgi:hypothetical protein